MTFDCQAVADLRARVLATGGPLPPLAAEAESLADRARAAADPAAEFELRVEALRLLAWRGEVAAAEPHLARLRALAPYRPGALAMAAEFARLAGDRRRSEAFCGAGWALGRQGMAFSGNGLLLGCWALAKADAEHMEWCIETGDDLAAAGKMGELDIIAFRGHAADAALDLEAPDLALRQAAAVVKAFPPDAVPPLAHFLWRRTVALHQVAFGEFDRDIAERLTDLVAEAERNGWTAWLPALDAALALSPEA